MSRFCTSVLGVCKNTMNHGFPAFDLWNIYTLLHTCKILFVSVFNMEFYGQTISKSSSEPYDLVRTSRMAGYGLLILGPSLHLWFNLMSKLFPKRDLISTLKKMAMGQLLYGPTMTVVFFSLNARLQGMRTIFLSYWIMMYCKVCRTASTYDVFIAHV